MRELLARLLNVLPLGPLVGGRLRIFREEGWEPPTEWCPSCKGRGWHWADPLIPGNTWPMVFACCGKGM